MAGPWLNLQTTPPILCLHIEALYKNGLRASVHSGRCLRDGPVFHQDGLCMIIVLANHHVYRQVTGLTVC